MGAVYKARQKQLDRLVALKILPPLIGQDEAFAERFMREARSLARLNHPRIVSIHDFGHTEAGLYYFIMEYVDRRSSQDSGIYQNRTGQPVSCGRGSFILVTRHPWYSSA